MIIESELKGNELTLTLMAMLLGVEGKDWAYYESDSDWWELRLYTRIN